MQSWHRPLLREVQWPQKINYLLQNARHQPGSILCDFSDQLLVKAVLEAILVELKRTHPYRFEVISQMVNTLITIVGRNIAITLPEKVCDKIGNTVIDILSYVQKNINKSTYLRRIENISGHFNISEGYLGRYFKKHTGESLQQYIVNYKFKLIQTRLQHSDMRINEIVNVRGFTDEAASTAFLKNIKR